MTDTGNASDDKPADGSLSNKRMLLIFGGAGGLIAVIGIVVVLVMSLNGGVPGSSSTPEGPEESLPPLAQACPPPSTEPPEEEAPPPDTEENRTIDEESGISYKEYGDPWMDWHETWQAGELAVEYRTGQYFVTEDYSGGQYRASILSGHVPAAVNDGTALDLECVGEQVTADVRDSYYPQPNEMEAIRSEEETLGGQPAWINIFRLSFSQEGLEATDELVGVALMDVGRADAAVLYVSIPGTHDEHDDAVDEVLESALPIEE